MHSFKVILFSLILVPFSHAGTVIIGWHSFDLSGKALGNEAPDDSITGVSGRLGNVVIDNVLGGAGGGQKAVAQNSEMTPLKYGSQYDLLSPRRNSSSVLMSANGKNNSIARLDFTITNHTDNPITLEAIHFDCKLVYGTVGESWVQLVHLSGKSDLEAKPWPGFSPSDKLYPGAYSWYDGDVALDGMEDLVLAGGETAAFRIEVGIDGEAPAGLNIDNIAIIAVESQ